MSFRPSTMCSRSSAETDPIFLQSLAVDNVLIWPILTQDRFGRRLSNSSAVNGNGTRGSWLVTASAITVPERSLNILLLRTRTGRRPACSLPIVGSSSAQTISPLSILAILPNLPLHRSRRTHVLPQDRGIHTPERALID